MSEQATSSAVGSPLENKAVEILDASQKALGAFSDKMMELAQQYGPEVADAALTMARIDAAQHLVQGVLMLAAGAALFYGSVLCFRRAKELPYSDFDVGCTLAGFIALFPTAFGVMSMTNIWFWVGIFEPKLWLAKRILGL